MEDNKKVRIPKQSRSKNTKNKIIETAIDLFSKKGYNNTSSNEIAFKAEVSIGSFYAYFKDKKQLFLEVFKNYGDIIKKNIDSNVNIDIENMENSIFSFINATLQAHKCYLGFHKQIIIMQLSDDDVKEIVSKHEKIKFELFKSYFELYKNHITTCDVEAASFLIYSTIEHTIHMIVFSETPVDEQRIIKELVSMILKYIEK